MWVTLEIAKKVVVIEYGAAPTRVAGAADYLIKPFEFTQLQTKLEAFAARADALESDRGAGAPEIRLQYGTSRRPSGATGWPCDGAYQIS